MPSFSSHPNLDNINDSSSHHLDNLPSASHSPHLENHTRNRSIISPRHDDPPHFISPLSPPPNSQPPNLQQFHSPSLINFSQQPPLFFAAPQPIPAQSAPFTSRPLPSFPPPNPPPPVPAPPPNNINPTLPTSFNSSLPSTKDVPLLSGKHDWGPWHSAVRTLIQNANLLGHIADNPYPGATFDPGLWPTYPPVVHQRSTQTDIQAFIDWWSRDGLASHILTSRLSPSVLGCLPIANERMGQRQSSRTVYLTLRHQYGAGDYSAVMVIEARLRQLKCLPSRGGVRLVDFITTWRTSLNQMPVEAAGFLPSPRQLLSIFADGLPQSTVAFVNLYDNIILCLNEPNDQLLPNIHHLFDRAVNLDN